MQNPGHLFTQLSLLDNIALIFLLLAWHGLKWRIEHQKWEPFSSQVIMARYRESWMVEMITRDPRIFDATILNGLRQGTSFFASGCIIAIGGCIALLERRNQFQEIAQDLGHTEQFDPGLWDGKILLITFILAVAVLKFIWSHRLFGYCAVIMAAVPNDVSDPKAEGIAAQAADLANCASRHFNGALRAVYFALATVAWLLGAVPFLAALVITAAIIWRREFRSETRRILTR